MDAKEIINNLELAETVIPNYTRGRDRGLTDSETERLVNLSMYRAFEMLEKQVPKQVVRIENVASQACPVCESKVNWKYCSNCGQKLVY